MVIRARLPFRVGGVDWSNSEQAFDGPNDTANRHTDDRADGSRDAVPLVTSMRHAVGNPLRLRGERRSE